MYGTGTLGRTATVAFPAGLSQASFPCSGMGVGGGEDSALGGQHMFPVGRSLCQPENKVFSLVWSPQCSGSAPGSLLGLPLPSSPKKVGLIIHSSILLSIYVPGTILGPGDTVVDLDRSLAYILIGEIISKSIT